MFSIVLATFQCINGGLLKFFAFRLFYDWAACLRGASLIYITIYLYLMFHYILLMEHGGL